MGYQWVSTRLVMILRIIRERSPLFFMRPKDYKEKMSFRTIILAAGQGTRMKSNLPKPLHKLGGKPMLAWVLDTSFAAGADGQVVITPKDSDVIDGFINAYTEARKLDVQTAIQDPQKGTGHAVECAKEALKDYNGIIIVAFADTPLVQTETYQALAKALETSDAAIACLGFDAEDPTGYGRLVTDDQGRLLKITEEKDANDEEKAIAFVNAGMMALKAPLAFELLEGLHDNTKTGEKYLTDCIEAARAKGHDVLTIKAEQTEVLGVNDRADLAQAEAVMQNQLRQAAMAAGATLIAPETVFLHHDAVIEPDVIIEPHVVISKAVHIGEGSEIKSFSHLEGVKTGPCCVIGPYARLRPGTDLGEGVKIGNFVETKNITMGDLSKANHLTYLGDSTIGSKTNIGAGTITCNYDGFNKNRTTIGDGAFIGSNSSLVAPVSIGDRALIGAGSTITRDVADDALAIVRGDEKTLPGGAERLRQKYKRTKA